MERSPSAEAAKRKAKRRADDPPVAGKDAPPKHDERSGLDQDQPFDLYALPGYQVRRLQQIVTSACLMAWNGLNITPLQYAALMATRAYPGVDQRGLARAIAIDRSTVGTVVGQLENAKLLARRTGRRDRRNKEIYLTAKGAALLRKAHPIAWEIQDTYLGVLSDRERTTFVELLAKLVERNNHLSRAPMDLSGIQ